MVNTTPYIHSEDRRAPNDNRTTPAILPEDHIDALRLNPYSYIKVPATGNKGLSAGSPYLGSMGAYANATGTTNEEADIFDLSAIEDIQWAEKYADGTKILTYSVTLKIRNTSISPDSTVGVKAQLAVV